MAEIISTKVQDLPVASSRENLEIPGFDISTNAAAKLTAEQLVGGIGHTPNITITAESIPNGEAPTVSKTGDAENPNFLFGIPLAKNGTNAPTPQAQYSTDGSSWHFGYQTGDSYYRMSYDNGSTWSNAIPTNQGVIASGGIADKLFVDELAVGTDILSYALNNQVSSTSQKVWCNNAVNSPSDANQLVCYTINKHSNNNYGNITATDFYNGVWVNGLVNGVWQGWVKVATADQLNTKLGKTENAAGTTITNISNIDITEYLDTLPENTTAECCGNNVAFAPTEDFYLFTIRKYNYYYATITARAFAGAPNISVTYERTLTNRVWSVGWQKLAIENTNTEWHYETTPNAKLNILYRKNKAGMVEMTLRCFNKNDNDVVRLPAGFVPPIIGDGSSGGTTSTYITLNPVDGSGEDKVVYEIQNYGTYAEVYWYASFGNADPGLYQATYTYEPVA